VIKKLLASSSDNRQTASKITAHSLFRPRYTCSHLPLEFRPLLAEASSDVNSRTNRHQWRRCWGDVFDTLHQIDEGVAMIGSDRREADAAIARTEWS
jgi:hypothetical protein